MALADTWGSGMGQGWHPGVPTTALAKAAPLRAARGSCQAHVHHPCSAVSREVFVSGDAQERLVLPAPIPDGCDADGDASRQPSMMPLRCQENSTGLCWGPGEQSRPLRSLQPRGQSHGSSRRGTMSPPRSLGTSGPHPMAAGLCRAAMEGFILAIFLLHSGFLQGPLGESGCFCFQTRKPNAAEGV